MGITGLNHVEHNLALPRKRRPFARLLFVD
jgi:hypothetical protein